MAEYRYYLIPDAMTRAFPEKFEKQTPTEFFDNIADLEKRYHQLREMPYNNERTWNERARFPYARLVVGVDRQNPDGAVAIIQVRNGVNYLCDDYRGPYADGSDAQIPQMAKKLVEVIGVDRVRPHTYTQRDGYTWVQVEKDMHITEWLYAHELCSSLQFTRFLNRDGRELFQVRDGQRVIETNADGTKWLRAVKNIDVTHAYVGHYGCHMQVVSYIVMVEVLPFLGLGFIHRDGYPFEKLVKIYWAWHSENAAVPIRPYKESRNVQKKRTRRNSECETYCRRDEKAARKGRKAAVKAAAQIRKAIRKELRTERPQHQEAPCT